jgi:hypothetical protein
VRMKTCGRLSNERTPLTIYYELDNIERPNHEFST